MIATMSAMTAPMSRPSADAAIRERLRRWLRYYKRELACTNEGLAEKLGVATTTITNILNGKRTAGLDMLVRMHNNLDHGAGHYLVHDPPQPGKPRPGDE